ncbi:ATP-dependent DNA helicase RecG [Methyloceanibacter superfactus]|uniref:ATP-dependent DNA helicase RecG n=1 Tax=Methyloceanibacter superfactus TaxID=1774969 RepID=UPI000ACE0C71|nr:ATP-dependent DNA helicase RecG [Methyloceanibacter superfactus]
MRPPPLAPLFASARALKGVGPRIEGLLNKLVAPRHQGAHARAVDLLWHLPVGIVDRTLIPRIADARAGELATLEVRVAEHRPGGERGGRRAPYKILVEDDSGALELIYFKADPAYLKRLLPVGSQRLISGKLEAYDGYLQMPHPDHVAAPEGLSDLPLIEPVYPLTAGLSNTTFRKVLAGALAQLPDLPEWIDAGFLAKKDWPRFAEAIARLHAPQGADDLLLMTPARSRLAYDELLANQLALAIIRQRLKKRAGRPLRTEGKLRQTIQDALPFALTAAQHRALAEIDADLASPNRMLRLLQGDVGSGKTVVALLAMTKAIEAGAQAALMAPTELLARQHLATIGASPSPPGCGSRSSPAGSAAASAMPFFRRRMRIDILIGTHALFQETIQFRDLALVVIDEQHRFGVHQRLALQAKGPGTGAELLVMTATRSPARFCRATAIWTWTRLDEKPPGRKPIVTRTVPLERFDEVVDGVARAVAGGAQVYWVCPLVAESEVLDVAAAEDRFAALRSQFGEHVGLVHGRLTGKEKDAVMAQFASGALSVLVSTTVIEVGVDVPNASIMIIEHAERFGLAQLHQLRGRVGRGAAESSCILLYRQPLSETARERLNVMRSTEDGFVIAEEDLRLRGGGEVLGTRQSGLPAFRIAVLPDHRELLEAARDEARLRLSRDPDLTGKDAEALRLLLYLFERDDAIRLMRAG